MYLTNINKIDKLIANEEILDNFKGKYLEFLGWFNDNLSNYEVPEEPKELYKPIKYALSGTAKRLRPAILTFVGESYGSDRNELFPAAMSIEMIHNFSLVHDDIMDNDLKRHGQISVHKKWDDNIGILTGDGIYTIALKELLFYNTKQFYEISKVLLRSILQVCEGQSYDIEFSHRKDISPKDYLMMVEKKTGYLLAVSAVIGAIIGGASLKEQNIIKEYMLILGKIFQIQDDLLEITASSEKMGKSLGSDLKEGKKTFPIIIAYKMANQKQITELDKVFGNNTITQNDMIYFRELITKIGVIDEIDKFILNYKEKLKNLLKKLPKIVASELNGFSEFIFKRTN